MIILTWIHFTLALDSGVLSDPAFPQKFVVAEVVGDVLVLRLVTVRVGVTHQVGVKADRDVVPHTGEVGGVSAGLTAQARLQTGVLAVVRVQDVRPLLSQPVEVLLQPGLGRLWLSLTTHFSPASLILSRLTEELAVLFKVDDGITCGVDSEDLVRLVHAFF